MDPLCHCAFRLDTGQKYKKKIHSLCQIAISQQTRQLVLNVINKHPETQAHTAVMREQ